MKQLTCEMCGSTDLIKQDGLFVCQTCGWKYSVEEARKMMIEGTVSIQGSVKIDNTDELKNLYTAARNARKTSDDATALKHYESISAKDPNSWEALFYLVILKTSSIKNGEIASVAISISNCLPQVFRLISESNMDESEKKQAVDEVVKQCYDTSSGLIIASHNFYKSLTMGNGLLALTGAFGALSSAGSTLAQLTADNDRCVKIANIMSYCGNYIEEYFDMNDEDYRQYAVWSWKRVKKFHYEYPKVHANSTLFDNESVKRFNEKIAQYTSQDETVLTVCFEYCPVGASQLWYDIDGGEKKILEKDQQAIHPLDPGSHTFNVLNPFIKKQHKFDINGPKTIHVYSKAMGMQIQEE